MNARLIPIPFIIMAAASALAQPTITRQPADFSVSLGANVTNTVIASGTAPFTYQWRFNDLALIVETNRSLVLTNIQLPRGGNYSVVVTDSSGSVTSRLARLTVDPTFTKITTGNIVTDVGDFQPVGWADFDRDGYLDLFVANSGNNALYRNNQNGTFTKVTNDPIVRSGSAPYSFAWGDYDNDGYPDVFIANFDGQNNLLYHNNGNATFTRITNSMRGTIVNDGGNSYGCSWSDYDNDGFLDLFVANRNQKSFLYRNNSDGTFTKITNSVVVTDVGSLSSGSPWADYDNDGDLDLFVGNGGNNFLYRSNGDGTFAKITNSVIIKDAKGSDGSAWADYDNDGDLDLFVTNLEATGNGFYLNNGDGIFGKLTNSVVVLDKRASTSCAWADYDNDGFLDLFVANGIHAGVTNANNFLYHNNGDGTFIKVTEGSPVNDGGDSLGCAWADYDNDGFLDLFVANGAIANQHNFLYRNNGNSNHWIKAQLIGTVSNRSAIGAKVRLKAVMAGTERWQLREISSGDGFSGNSLIAHFGLGDATTAETVRIEWPSGTVQELHNVAANQMLTVTEPTKLEPHVMQANGFVELKVKSWKGFVYGIEASNDLKSWSRLTTLTNETGTLSFADPLAGDAAQRFYRVVGK